MVKRVGILLEDFYNEFEFWYPYYRLKEAEVEVLVVGPAAGATCHAKGGLPARADVAADAVTADDLDGLVVPGGYAPDRMRRNPAMLKLVGEVFRQGKPVAAICHAAWVLVSAGVLRGRRATCFFSVKDDLINAGARYENAEVVVDGNLITSRQPEDLPTFMKALLAALEL